jgi:uncharacterized protein (DUF983 family)
MEEERCPRCRRTFQKIWDTQDKCMACLLMEQYTLIDKGALD